MRHRLGGIALAFGGALGDGLFDRGEIGFSQLEPVGCARLRPLPALAGADQRDDVVPLRKDPSDCGCGDARPPGMRDFAQALNQRKIVVEILASEA